MILQALYEYYQRKAADRESGIAPEGFQWQDIPFVVVIDHDGRFVSLEDTREGVGRKRRAKSFLVPAAEKKSVNIKANLLWGNVEYTLGANPRGRKDIPKRHSDFLRRLSSDIGEHPDRNILLKFLASNPVAQIERSKKDGDKWNEVFDSNPNILFRIEGAGNASICESLASRIRRADSEGTGICLVSGGNFSAARIHPSIKGVRDAQSSGAALVSFNHPAFRSFRKEQNYNAPVSESATFAYTEALNLLLGRDSKSKVQIGDATTVFWSEKKTSFEEDFAFLWSAPPKDDPDRGVKVVEVLLRSPFTGAGIPDVDTRFYLLGLAPNAARISVRFWYTGTIAEIRDKIRQHFLDLEIIRPKNDKGSYALFFLLADIAVENKIENVPPNLVGNIMRSILSGGPYPDTLLQQTIRRIRAQPGKQEIKHTQAAILKACLNRLRRSQNNPAEEEITVALDLTNTNPGYRLGRLFAVMEKIQEEANPGINTTIRDRYFGSASASPMLAFSVLNRLSKHHLAKLENRGRAVNMERLTGEIADGLDATNPFPATLNLTDQGRFFVGYYHQRQSFFTKSNKSEQ
jgi:CRISPR-associated protein Csd1